MLRWFACLLAVFCLLVVARIEWLDFHAGGVLGQELGSESAWRIDSDAEPDPRDSLVRTLKTWGVALHLCTVALIFLALFRQARDGPWRVGWSVLASVGLIVLMWAFLRGYLSALGW